MLKPKLQELLGCSGWILRELADRLALTVTPPSTAFANVIQQSGESLLVEQLAQALHCAKTIGQLCPQQAEGMTGMDAPDPTKAAVIVAEGLAQMCHEFRTFRADTAEEVLPLQTCFRLFAVHAETGNQATFTEALQLLFSSFEPEDNEPCRILSRSLTFGAPDDQRPVIQESRSALGQLRQETRELLKLMLLIHSLTRPAYSEFQTAGV